MKFQNAVIALVWSAAAASASAEFTIPGLNALRFSSDYTADRDLKQDEGNLDILQLGVSAQLTKEPVKPIDHFSIIPVMSYRYTSLDFSGNAVFPVQDQDLHSISASSFFIYACPESRWVYGGFAGLSMSSDFQAIDGDDFTGTAAGGAAYQFNDQLMLGFGGIVANINGDVTAFPVIGFDWKVNPRVRVGFYGPLLTASYAVSPNWILSLRGSYQNEQWNIDDSTGRSRNIGLSGFKVGLQSDQKLTDNFWLTVGAGYAFAGKIELTSPSGSQVSKRGLGGGLYAQVMLSMKTWYTAINQPRPAFSPISATGCG